MRKIGKAKRQKTAKIRDEANSEFTVVQKIERLDKRLGKDIGAEKERKRLLAGMTTLNENTKK